MVEYEENIIKLIEEKQDEKLMKTIELCRDIMIQISQIRVLLDSAGEILLKVILGIIVILFAVCIFGIQTSLIPISVISFFIALWFILIFLISLFIIKVPLQSWLDILPKEKIQEINEIIKENGLQIVDTKNELLPNSQCYMRKVVETMDSIEP